MTRVSGSKTSLPQSVNACFSHFLGSMGLRSRLPASGFGAVKPKIGAAAKACRLPCYNFTTDTLTTRYLSTHYWQGVHVQHLVGITPFGLMKSTNEVMANCALGLFVLPVCREQSQLVIVRHQWDMGGATRYDVLVSHHW